MRTIFLLSLLSSQAFGCVCSGWPSARDAWAGSELVFVGVVDRTEPSVPSMAAQTVWVTVKESFKGTSVGDDIALKQGGNDCAPKYQAGAEVVFYLSQLEPGFWVAPGCHRSRHRAIAPARGRAVHAANLDCDRPVARHVILVSGNVADTHPSQRRAPSDGARSSGRELPD